MNLFKARVQDIIFYFYNLCFFLKKEWTLQQNFIKIINILPVPEKS